jgi:CubicO group peptidase (beta-lactamase class C family)
MHTSRSYHGFTLLAAGALVCASLVWSARDAGAQILVPPSTTVDLEAMEASILADLSGKAVGFAYVISQNGVMVIADAQGSAKRPVDGGVAMTPFSRMQVASVNKTIAAVATLKLLEQNGLSVDTLVAPYLPSDWIKGYGVWGKDGLTFRHLLTHTSGFDQMYQALSPADQLFWDNDWDGLQFIVSNGAIPDSPRSYRNANFALLRVLVPALWKATGVHPGIGNITSANHGSWFRAYVQDRIFTPMGIHSVTCSGQANYAPALGYDFDLALGNGASGNVSDGYCGGHAGLHLSAMELAAFMAYIRYDDAMLSPANRLLMNSDRIGWDTLSNTNGNGRLGKFWHGGDWLLSADREMHACIMKYPNNIEATLIVNSDIVGGKNQCTVLKDAYNNALP